MSLLKFYITQGLHSSKKNAIIIFILALSLALIPALSMLVNGFFQTVLREMPAMGEVPVGSVQILKPAFYEHMDFSAEEEYIRGVLQENQIEPINFYSNLEFYMSNAFIYSNHSFPTQEVLTNPDYKNCSANFGRQTPRFEFYDQSRFESSFYYAENYTPADYYYYDHVIIEGRIPQNKDEILIDYKIAQKFNLSVGSSFQVNLRINQDQWKMEYDEEDLNSTNQNNTTNHYYYNEKDYYTDIPFPNLIISGFYLVSVYYDSTWDYNYQDYIEHKPFDVYNLDKDFYNSYNSIFSYYDFSLDKDENAHPILQYIDEIKNLSICNNQSSLYYYDTNRYSHFDANFVFDTEFQKINLNALLRLSREVEQIDANIRNELGSDYYFSWDMVYIIPEMAVILYAARAFIAIINLPILIFVISLGVLSARIIRKIRIPDYLRFRIKGLTRKMVTRLSSVEALMNSLFATILSFILGLILFYALRGEAIRIFESISMELLPFPATAIKPTVLSIDILNVLIWSLLCSFIMYIPIFYYNRKLKLSDLIQIKEAKDLPVVYDEVTIYDRNADQVKLNWDEFLQIEQSENDQILDEIKPKNKILKQTRNKRKKKKNKKKSAIYEDVIKQFERKIPKIAIILIIIGLIPIMVNYLLFYSLDHSPPDFLIDLLRYLEKYQTVFIIISIFTPILILYGILRFIGIEKPSRFAKLSKVLSKPILGTLNRLFGLKMISSKELIKWIRVFTTFATILISINMITQSVYRYQIVADNLMIGGDVKLVSDINVLDPSFSPEYINDYINQSEFALKNLVNENNESYVRHVTTCSQFYGYYKSYNYYHEGFTVFSANISQYLYTITEGDKVLPNKNISGQIEKLMDYEKNRNENDLPGVLISKDMIYSIDDYDNTLTFNLTYYNISIHDTFQKSFTFKVLGDLEFPPGLTYRYGGYYSSNHNFVLIDNKILNYQNYTIHSDRIYQFLDLDLNLAPNSTTISQNITQTTENFMQYDSITFYNQDFLSNTQNPEIFSLFSIFQIIEIVMYFLGLVLAVTLGLLLNAIKDSDERFYSLLYTRGYGRKGNWKILLSQIWVMFVLGSFLGFICGYLLPSVLVYQIQQQFSYNNYYYSRIQWKLPIYWEPFKILIFLASILVTAVFMLFIVNFFKKNNVNKSLQQF